MAHDGAAHGHPLALAAGERLGLARSSSSSRPRIRDASCTRSSISALGDLLELEAEGHVVEHAHVRVQRVVLEDHGDVAVLGRHVVDDPVADAQLALGDRLEAGDHAQRRGLAAARRADEHHELPVGDVQATARGRPRCRRRRPSRRRPGRSQPSGCLPAGGAVVAADHQLEGQAVLGGDDVGAALDGVEQVAGAEVAAVEQWLAHGGEADVGRQLDVVEADDGEVLGHPQALAPRRLDARRWPARRTPRRSPWARSRQAQQLVGHADGRGLPLVGAVAHVAAPVAGCRCGAARRRSPAPGGRWT